MEQNCLGNPNKTLSLLFFYISLFFFKTVLILNKDLVLCCYCSVFHLEYRVVVESFCLWPRDIEPNVLSITSKLLLMQHEICWHQIDIKKWNLTIVMVSDIKIELSVYFFIEKFKANRTISYRICSKPTLGKKRTNNDNFKQEM